MRPLGPTVVVTRGDDRPYGHRSARNASAASSPSAYSDSTNSGPRSSFVRQPRSGRPNRIRSISVGVNFSGRYPASIQSLTCSTKLISAVSDLFPRELAPVGDAVDRLRDAIAPFRIDLDDPDLVGIGRLPVRHEVLDRRILREQAVPVVVPIDLDGPEDVRNRGRSQDRLRREVVLAEEFELAREHVDGADQQRRFAPVQQVGDRCEVDVTLEQVEKLPTTPARGRRPMTSSPA